MYYVFALATEQVSASEVYDTLIPAEAIETLMKEGHDLVDIRVVNEEDAKGVSFYVED